MNNIVNLSTVPMWRLYNWIPHDLEYKKIVFFPDVCPSKSLMPTGSAILTSQSNWRKYTISDIGCGMTLLESNLTLDDFKKEDWSSLLKIMKLNKIHSLGSGNHFLMNYVSLSNKKLYFLIHTGSRLEGKDIEKHLNNLPLFDKEYKKVIDFAIENRMGIKEMIDKVFGNTKLVLDKVHNSHEILPSGDILIRKGTVKLLENELTVIPSNMDGYLVLVKAKKSVKEYLNSLQHGTGRCFSRSEAKEIAKNYDYESLRKRIYIPDEISNDSIKTEAPFCYRDLDECMRQINEIINEVDRFTPVSYIGQL